MGARTSFIVALAVALPGASRADNFAELLGGVSVPSADNQWTSLADTSPKLQARAGAVGTTGVGGMLQADWTPVNLKNSGGSFGIGSADISAHRFRLLADAVIHKSIANKLVITARAGAGIDIAHASAHVTTLGVTTDSSDTDLGFALELGGGLWFDLGGTQLGGELALPIGHHSKHGNNTDGNYTFDYTSYDLDILVGVRMRSR
jgi:hypothetical protein